MNINELDDISDRVFRIPGIESGFIFQQCCEDAQAFAPVPAVAGAKKYRITRKTEFRVCLRYNGHAKEHTALELRFAISETLKAHGIVVSEKLKKAVQYQASLGTAGPLKRSGEKDSDWVERRQEWETNRKEIALTLSMVRELETWLNS